MGRRDFWSLVSGEKSGQAFRRLATFLTRCSSFLLSFATFNLENVGTVVISSLIAEDLFSVSVN